MSDSSPELMNNRNLVPVMIEEEMRSSYLDYAMSVIVSRALPDVRDGLKPVHRRILYAMKESGFTADKPYRKTARAVGDVMGKFHPHGDSAIYDALVRLAQKWSMRVTLIDGQGNFGSIDGDSPAAMRYTEARLAKSASWLLDDIDRDTVDFQPNYDESEEEPTVLPAAYPNLLVNGSAGIAVGMATNIPTHNPTEVIDATMALIDNPEMDIDQLMEIIPAPDFPTGGIIMGRSGIRQAFETGRGSIPMRGRASIEEIRKDRQAIIITEIPYQVNKATLQEKMAELVKAKTIEGVSDIRDESDRSGMRVVIELKRDATPEVVLNQLYRYTQLQCNFSVNMVALDGGRPKTLNLKQVLQAFIAFREEVITRRARHDLDKARARGHLLIGLSLAVANIDEVIRMIRSAPDATTARESLMDYAFPAGDIQTWLDLVDDESNAPENGKVHLTETQARAILELRLQRLTGLERDKIISEMNEIGEKIKDLLDILADRVRRMAVMRSELELARASLASPRMTEISDAIGGETDESLIEPGQMVVTITRDGFIKRTPLDIFRSQNRGGRGRTAAGRRGDDTIMRSFNAHTHQWVLFFTSGGKAYRIKVWHLPEASPTSRGRALVNLLPEAAEDGEITAVLPLPQDEELWSSLYLVFATSSGYVRRNRLDDFKNIRSCGLIAMKLNEGDSLIGVKTAHVGDDVFLATKEGRVVRFEIADDTLRVFAGRASTGVRGVRLGTGDKLVSLSILPHVDATPEERTSYLKEANKRRRLEGEVDEIENDDSEESGEMITSDEAISAERFEELARLEEYILTVTDMGFGRRSSSFDYRATGRGIRGVLNMRFKEARRGKSVVSALVVREDEQVMLLTDTGRLIRLPVSQVRVMSRQASGVTLFRLDDKERVIAVFPVPDDDKDEDLNGAEEQEGEATAVVENEATTSEEASEQVADEGKEDV